MLVELSTGKKIYIQIKHLKFKNCFDANKEDRATRASIWDDTQIKVEEKDGKKQIRTSGYAYVVTQASTHYKDNFKRHTGLKIALRRAIDEFNMKKLEVESLPDEMLTKTLRKEIWDKVFNNKYNR